MKNALVEYNQDKCAACYMCARNRRCDVPVATPDRKRMIQR